MNSLGPLAFRMSSSTLVHSQISYGAREHIYSRALLPCVHPKNRYLGLDFAEGKVSLGGDGSKRIPFTSRHDITRYISYVLTHLPAEQLKNRSFSIAGDVKVRAVSDGVVSVLMIIVILVVQRDNQGI